MTEKAAAMVAEGVCFLLLLLRLHGEGEQAADIAGGVVLAARGGVSLQRSAVDEKSFARDAVFVDVVQMFQQLSLAVGTEPTEFTTKVMSG